MSRHAGTLALATLAMVAFAANSLLCRAALVGGGTDAASFTAIRMGSGALTLMAILGIGAGTWRPGGRLLTALMLFTYMLGFSLAYRQLSAATGALLLFGAVQLTMLGAALANGERFGARGWLGLALAITGFLALLAPGASAPPLAGASLMVIAGVAWGVYSLIGRGARNPLADTAGNFLMATPLTLIALIAVPFATGQPLALDGEGVVLAVLSGAAASGLGYVTWYAALRGLEAGQAATVQLSVPVLTALGGVVLLGEALGGRLLWAGALTMLGIWLTLHRRYQRMERPR